MGESERFLDRRIQKIRLGDDNNAMMALITINAIVFISLGLIQVIYFISQSSASAFQYEILRWFILPAKLNTLAVMPWTVLSYMFVNTGVIFTLVNMLWLWAFGSILQSLGSNDKIFPVYIYGGLAGAIVFIGINYMVPSLKNNIDYTWLFGSNAAVIALAIAATTLAPQYRMFRMINGGIPLWVLTLIFVIIDVAGNRSMPHQLAHLGGGLAGFLFIVSYNKGRDWGAWMHTFYSWLGNLLNPDKKAKSKPQLRNKIFYKTGDRNPFVRTPVITQQRVDQILDKINQKGFNYLTEEEKEILKRAGETEF
jgi:membrane associated rhomboid family serine protease